MIVSSAVIRADFSSPYWRVGASDKIPKIGGLTLLERQILALAKIGIQNVWIVIDPADTALRTDLQGRAWPVSCEVIENPHAGLTELSWLTAVSARVQGPFLALAGNMLCDKAFLKTLCEDFGGSHHQAAVHNQTHGVVAVFLPAIFSEIQQADTLTALLQRLKQKGVLHEREMKALYCETIDNLGQRRKVEKILLQSCRKDTDGFISRHINRRISLFISSLLLNTPVHANFMTLVTSLIGFASGYLAFCATPVTYAWAGVLFNLASILDGVDGELARIRLSDSKLGQWLDTLSDNGALIAFMGGTMWGLQKRVDLAQPAWLVPAALAGLLMLFFVMVYFLLKYTESGSLVAIKQKLESLAGLNPVVARVIGLNFLIRRDFFATAVMVVALLDKPHWVILGLAAATHVAWTFLLGVLVFGRRHLLES